MTWQTDGQSAGYNINQWEIMLYQLIPDVYVVLVTTVFNPKLFNCLRT
jgi:hypothetical protein